MVSIHTAEIAVRLDRTPVDFTRRFIAEVCTPLFHTPAYGGLPDAARLRYNQLHALYFNEQVAFFEREMLSPALQALQRSALPASLAAGLRTFFEEEQRHTAMFHAVNRLCAPEFYAGSVYRFVRIARPARAALRALSRWPRMFPLLVWLALLQEERSLHFSKCCLEQADDLEPHFLSMHRTHLADEVGHVGWDEDLLDWLWPRTSRPLRSINARLLGWMTREFFLLPKRSGLRVVEQLAREFPRLEAAALYHGMRELEANDAYLQTLYSREVTPRSFARFDLHPEFASFAQILPGYHPPGFLR